MIVTVPNGPQVASPLESMEQTAGEDEAHESNGDVKSDVLPSSYVTLQLNCLDVPDEIKKAGGTIKPLTITGCGTVIVDVALKFAVAA